jgi:hypothetical protein
MRLQIAASLPRTAHALRPMRIGRQGDAIHYEATTFPSDPYQGCELQVRRMECFGMLTRREQGPLQGSWFLDVLDAEGDILDTLEVNAQGVKYMRRTLYMKREDTSLLQKFDALATHPTKDTPNGSL